MGFTCGFYKTKRLNPADDIYTEFEKYNLAFQLDEALRYKWDTKEILDKAQVRFGISEEDLIQASRKCEELEDWCSSGSVFHDDLLRLVPAGPDMENPYEERVLDKQSTLDLLDYAWNKFENDFRLEPIAPARVFKVKTVDDESETTYRNVDGIEIMFDTSTKKDIWCVDGADCGLYASKQYFDEDHRYALLALIRCLVKILTTTDWDTDLIYYCGGC